MFIEFSELVSCFTLPNLTIPGIYFFKRTICVFFIVVIQIPDKPFPKENVTGSKGNIVDKVNKLSGRNRK